MPRAVENVFDAHFENDIGMGADPRTSHGNFAQHLIERFACSALMDWIDPDEHAIDRQQLFADCIGKAFVIDGWLRIDTQRFESLEHPDEAAIVWCGVLPGCSVASPDDSHRVTEREGIICVHERFSTNIV